MKTRQSVFLILLLTMLATSACTAIKATNTTEGCPTPAAGTKLLRNDADGYCLLYPEEYSTEIQHYIVINPISGAGDVPGDAWVSITAEDAAGRTAAQAADAAIAEVGPGFNITRTEAMVDGVPAVSVDGLPGQDSMRKVFIVHEARLYTLDFMPWNPTQAAGQFTPLENLYNLIMQTLHFLPPAT